jgi:S1-C subfamily serine protease
MRKSMILCAVAAILGGFVSVLIFGGNGKVDPLSHAQEMSGSASPNIVDISMNDTSPASRNGDAGSVSESELQSLTPEEQINISVYQKVNRGVVHINTKSVQNDRFMMFEEYTEGEGSGSVIDKAGHILTNFHVVDGAKEIKVALFDGRGYQARLIGVDPDTDIAVLKIEAPADSLNPVPMGNSTNLLVGMRVMAIGNPFGLERTLTTGIISSLNRSLPARKTQRTIRSIIQIDAAINPGNSGGPLLNNGGQMIGMNTAIASKTGENTGVGFAIPANTIARVVPQLIQNGHVTRPESGINPPLHPTGQGLLIVTLDPNGPAAKAGLKGPKIVEKIIPQGPFNFKSRTVDLASADRILAVDGKPVKTASDFFDLIDTKQPGDKITLTINRGGKQQEVALQLEAGE